jgi:hypothetical protein
MGTLADLRQKTADVGSCWIVERTYGIGKSELPVVEGFDQESVALERMGQLIYGGGRAALWRNRARTNAS